MDSPIVLWTKNDPEKYNQFSDGSVFLVALRVSDGIRERWDFDVVQIDCDGETASLRYRGSGDPYDAWLWDDFEYFLLLEGDTPSAADIDIDVDGV